MQITGSGRSCCVARVAFGPGWRAVVAQAQRSSRKIRASGGTAAACTTNRPRVIAVFLHTARQRPDLIRIMSADDAAAAVAAAALFLQVSAAAAALISSFAIVKKSGQKPD